MPGKGQAELYVRLFVELHILPIDLIGINATLHSSNGLAMHLGQPVIDGVLLISRLAHNNRTADIREIPVEPPSAICFEDVVGLEFNICWVWMSITRIRPNSEEQERRELGPSLHDISS